MTRSYVFTDPMTGRELLLKRWEAVDRVVRLYFGTRWQIASPILPWQLARICIHWRQCVRRRAR